MVLMIVSGRSGSGKSVALRALEDMGFYCVDNLPVVLFRSRVQIRTGCCACSSLTPAAMTLADAKPFGNDHSLVAADAFSVLKL